MIPHSTRYTGPGGRLASLIRVSALSERPDVTDQRHQQRQPEQPQRGPCHRLPRAVGGVALGLAADLGLDFPVPLLGDAFALAVRHGMFSSTAAAPKRRGLRILASANALASIALSACSPPGRGRC